MSFSLWHARLSHLNIDLQRLVFFKYLLKKNPEDVFIFQQFKLLVELQFTLKINFLKYDRGGEFRPLTHLPSLAYIIV